MVPLPNNEMSPPRRLWGLVSGAAGRLPTVLTLALLAGVAIVCARYDWKLPKFSELRDDAADDSPATVVKVVLDSSDPKLPPVRRIEFPSPAAVNKAGIKVGPVQVRPMATYITATGMLDYEPSGYARLTARLRDHRARGKGDRRQSPKRRSPSTHRSDRGRAGQGRSPPRPRPGRARRQVFQTMQTTKVSGSVPERSLREAETALREARIRAFNDHQRLLNLGLTFRLEELTKLPEDQMVRYLRLLGLPESIRKQYDPDTSTANFLPLTAPFDGLVVQRNAAPGEVVQGTQPKTLFVIGNVRSLHADVDVNPEDAVHLAVGQVVTFRPDGKDMAPVTGKLVHMSPEVDEKTRRVTAHAEVDNTDGRLRPNTFGTGQILIPQIPARLLSPTELCSRTAKTSSSSSGRPP